MSERIHLALCGERGTGKSTCIRRVIEELRPDIYGFITKSIPGSEEGFHDIFIHPASQPESERVRERRNQIGSCNKVIHRVNTDVFETIGVQLLSTAGPTDAAGAQYSGNNEIMVMDELGFMENEAATFQKCVMERFNGDIPVIAAIKPIVWSSFINNIRCHDKVEVIPLYERTREEVYAYVLERLTGIMINNKK